MHPDHVQAVEQIFTEFPLLHALFQVLVGGGDDPHIDLHRRVTAHAIKLTIRQHAQQTSLDIKRHIANFIQEQRTAVSLFKATLTDGIGAGKGSFFMAEQLGLNQVLGDRRHIQRDKRRF